MLVGDGRMTEYVTVWRDHEPTKLHWGVPVVRCRDCKHYTDDEMEYYHYCGSWCEQVTPDGYCAWGEQMDE